VSQIVWGGDPSTVWDFDGLQSAVRNGLTMGLSGVSLWGSDIGGFFSIARPELTPELLKRWIEFGAASGVMRTQANGSAIPPKGRRPQIFDSDVLPIWRRYAKLRTQLYPYLSAAESIYDETGMPIMRDLALNYPDDPAAAAREDEYLFGPDLLAAPVMTPGATTRALHLPPGRWIDLWRSAAYLRGDGSLRLGAARMLTGARSVTLPAPIDELPLLARAGTMLALLPPDVQTLAPYGRGMVHLADRAGAMQVLAWPRGASRARVGAAREWLYSREGAGRWTLYVRGRRTRSYSLQASLATLRHPFRPCSVLAGTRPLRRAAWRYDRRTRVLRVRFRVRVGRVVVRRCPPGPRAAP
jgi:hypothetical protein